jgi:thiaminase
MNFKLLAACIPVDETLVEKLELSCPDKTITEVQSLEFYQEWVNAFNKDRNVPPNRNYAKNLMDGHAQSLKNIRSEEVHNKMKTVFKDIVPRKMTTMMEDHVSWLEFNLSRDLKVNCPNQYPEFPSTVQERDYYRQWVENYNFSDVEFKIDTLMLVHEDVLEKLQNEELEKQEKKSE